MNQGVFFAAMLGIVGLADAGMAQILYGRIDGLAIPGSQYWHQNVGAIQATCEAGDHFGLTLAAGDLDGDDYDDLAIGAPDEEIGGMDQVGAVHVIFGHSTGLTDNGNQFWRQDFLNGSEMAAGDRFGFDLAVVEVINCPSWRQHLLGSRVA